MRRTSLFHSIGPSLAVTTLVIFAIALLNPTALAQSSNDARKPQETPDKPKLAKLIVDAAGGWVSAKGVWRPDNPTKKNELMEGVIELTCFRHGGRDIVGTEALCLEATASTTPSGMLTVDTQWLKVSEWSQIQIIASDDSSICVTQQWVFDLKRETVIALDVRKSEAHGLFNACDLLPDRQTYYLEDLVDYYGRKQVGETK